MAKQSIDLGLGSAPSHGNPASTTSLNTELNNIARNTNDTEKAKLLVAAGADLLSTNGPPWNHTPLHQASYHGRYEMACTLVALRADLTLHSNPCGRGTHGTPLELAQGGGHQSIAKMIEDLMKGQHPSLVATAISDNEKPVIQGHYFSFPKAGSPGQVVDRFEARTNGTTVTFYRNGPVGCTENVHPATARPMESYQMEGTTLFGPVTASVDPNGDILWSHGYISRKEDVRMLPKVVATPATQDSAQLPIPEGEVALVFSHVDHQAFDQNGVLNAIGSDWGSAPYSNPAETGKVKLGWSQDAANYYSTVCGHKVGDARQAASVICANTHPGANSTMWSKGAPKAYFEVDLIAVTLRATYFAYRNDYGGGGNHPRTFELQGSTDGRSWTTLSQHTNEEWSGKSAKVWPVHGHAYFRIFRIQNLGAPHFLCCSGFELYGLVRGAPTSIGASVDDVSAVGTPVVVGTVLETSNSAPLLCEIVQILKKELGVGGNNVVETVTAAVEVLGLEAEVAGLGLVDKARKCNSKLFG